jgi:hypothetical protein
MMVTAIREIDGDLIDPVSSSRRQSVRVWTMALFLSVITGSITGLAGLAIAFVTLSGLIAPRTTIYTISTLLIGASFILFGLAAHCLDKEDAADKASRLDYCRQHGLNG